MVRESVDTAPSKGDAVNFAKQEAGFKIEGKLLGHTKKPNKFNPSQDSYVWKFEKKSGDAFAVFGKTRLDRGLLSIPVGSYVWIEYLGKQMVDGKVGKVQAHVFKVEADSDNAAVVGNDAEQEIPY